MGSSTSDFSFNLIFFLPHCSTLDLMTETISYSYCASGLAQIKIFGVRLISLIWSNFQSVRKRGLCGPLVYLKKETWLLAGSNS